MDTSNQALMVLPLGGGLEEAVSFILIAVGYSDDTYGLAVGSLFVQPLLDYNLTETGQDVNPKKWATMVVQMCGIPFPRNTPFRSLGARVHTTYGTASGPLILKH